MARLYHTGFEMGTNPFDIGAITIVSSQSPGSWSTYQASGGNAPQFSIGASVSEFYMGFRFLNTTGATGRMVNFRSPNGTDNTSLYLNNPGGFIDFSRGDHATILASGPTILKPSRWYYIEVYMVISDTVGKYQVKIDGVDEIALTTGVDTRNDAGVNGDKVSRIYMVGDNSNHYVDDIYINDATGSVNNGFAGDVAIKGYIQNAAGDVTGLSRGGVDSGSNYGQVDERPANDATDYVGSTAINTYDLYNIPDTSGVGSVQAVMLWLRAQKADAGAAAIAPMLKSGATEATGADQALSNSWDYYHQMYDLDPTDSGNWTSPKLDALQVGVKVR